MKKVVYLGMIFLVLLGCSDNLTEQDEIALDNIEAKFIEEIDFLTSKNSMLITPSNHEIQQTILFSPQGKENSLLKNMGFDVNQSSTFYARSGDCTLSKMGAAKAVGKITDSGGCAQVRKGSNGKYCVKKIKCQ